MEFDFQMAGGSANGDRRLYLKCCGSKNKEECTWAPCPANLDCYTPEELRSFINEDAHRVDDAVAIWNLDASEGGVPLNEIIL